MGGWEVIPMSRIQPDLYSDRAWWEGLPSPTACLDTRGAPAPFLGLRLASDVEMRTHIVQVVPCHSKDIVRPTAKRNIAILDCS